VFCSHVAGLTPLLPSAKPSPASKQRLFGAFCCTATLCFDHAKFAWLVFWFSEMNFYSFTTMSWMKFIGNNKSNMWFFLIKRSKSWLEKVLLQCQIVLVSLRTLSSLTALLGRFLPRLGAGHFGVSASFFILRQLRCGFAMRDFHRKAIGPVDMPRC
jgi:hypothetical protein